MQHSTLFVCGRCAGRTDFSYQCPRCGRAGFAYTAGRCVRCEATDRVHELLQDPPTGALAEHWRPFVAALATVDSPEAILQWFRPRGPAVALLSTLAKATEPLTHDLLDRFPPGPDVHRLRRTLIHTGVLPDRAEYLERLEPWLEGQLADLPTEQAHLIGTYARWVLLRRARQRTSAGHPFTSAAGNWARTRIRASIRLLTWLDNHGLTLATAAQQHIDTWLVTGSRETTYPAREFLNWARRRHLTTLAIPKKQPLTSLAPITEDHRWEQLRRCLHDTSLPTKVRAAGALVLLYGLPVSRVTALRHDNIDTDSTGRTWLLYGDHRLRLPPAVAVLLLNQRDDACTVSVIGRSHPPAQQWLFPGGLPGQPTQHGIYRALHNTSAFTSAAHAAPP